MWTETTSSGKLRAIEYYCDIDGKRRKVSVSIQKETKQALNKAKKEIEAKIEKILEEQQAEKDRANKKINTVEELCKAYLEEKEAYVKPSSFYSYRGECVSFETLYGKDFLIKDFKSGFINTVLSPHRKNPTLFNHYLRITKRILEWAYRRDFIEDSSFLDKVEIVKDKEKKARIQDKFLEQNELRVLVNSMSDNQQWQLLTEFLALTGMRIGEAVALQWTDVKDNYIDINKTYMCSIREMSDTPKTMDSRREIDVQPELQDLLKRIKKYDLEMQLKKGRKSDLIFFNQGGGAISDVTYRAYLKTKALKVLNKNVVPHSLRHTHVSLLAEQGFTLEEISLRMGHADSKVTREIYYHVTEKRKQQISEKMRKIKIM